MPCWVHTYCSYRVRGWDVTRGRRLMSALMTTNLQNKSSEYLYDSLSTHHSPGGTRRATHRHKKGCVNTTRDWSGWVDWEISSSLAIRLSHVASKCLHSRWR